MVPTHTVRVMTVGTVCASPLDILDLVPQAGMELWIEMGGDSRVTPTINAVAINVRTGGERGIDDSALRDAYGGKTWCFNLFSRVSVKNK